MTDSGRASIYRGRLIELGLETAELPNGATIELEIVRHPGGAVVLALDEGDRVCLLAAVSARRRRLDLGTASGV